MRVCVYREQLVRLGVYGGVHVFVRVVWMHDQLDTVNVVHDEEKLEIRECV